LSAEDEVSELGKGEEDDEEHDGKASQVLGAGTERRRQLRHRLVETDVLEYLQKPANGRLIVMITGDGGEMKGKEKERKSIYKAPFRIKRSGMHHTVLPANNTMPAFPS